MPLIWAWGSNVCPVLDYFFLKQSRSFVTNIPNNFFTLVTGGARAFLCVLYMRKGNIPNSLFMVPCMKLLSTYCCVIQLWPGLKAASFFVGGTKYLTVDGKSLNYWLPPSSWPFSTIHFFELVKLVTYHPQPFIGWHSSLNFYGLVFFIFLFSDFYKSSYNQ